MTDPDLTTRTEGEGETLDLPEGMQGFTPGQVLGERYQILEMLGRGGMGEVWHAFDLKLRVEVALKALRQEFFKSDRRLELLRQEVRAAREVVSPNVCRIFDLIEVEGRELVSMEYVDGATLLAVLYERGPLELKEAQDIASQFLAGLEAIHKVGLIHRDIKPENIMLTRAGRVVVMDFGLARQETEGGGTVSGTPAYMSPEQAAGQTLDARADVYAAGVVLAEMVSPDGIKSFDSRQSVWEGVRSEPAKVPDSPWAPVIQKAVKKDREGRFNSAHTLTRALEDVTLRVEGADDLHPYPGLASFTEADAEYFFGREAEVEQMWRKLEGPPRMLAIVGPSGAGKSSFIAAGLVAHAPPNWGIIRSTPGTAAISSLARVVARETAGDPDAVELLPRFGDAEVAVLVLGHWARKNTHALVVVDQFEELFTQNVIEEQRRFAELLRRFVLEGNIHVLLSMRDDFAAACNVHEPLRSIFHELTVLDPPTGGNLRRAVVQPATKCGYRFEDDELVDEILAEVEGERGALPLLAFAAARLWERRDKKRGLLTLEAYQEIGGVGGALAQHAEATIDRIGVERIPLVRELFRNLVTAEGTRAVREWDELLSIFCDSSDESPAAVLRQLIDARLLTSYEIHEDEHEPTRRVEIIHESLLANWPRLVRWQTQDQDGAQLRDELRQAARAWDDHDRQDDRLWTGTAFREYRLWRERYPGGLTDLEEAFAAAMISFATRRKRRRRIAAGVGTVVLLAVLAVVTGLWRHSVQQTRRAEASKLLTLGHLNIDDSPTMALACATKSLEISDTPEARRLAMRALWAGPPVFSVPYKGAACSQTFSPDGSHLAVGDWGGAVRLYPRDGGEPIELTELKGKGPAIPFFSPDSRHVVAGAADAGGAVVLWKTEGGPAIRTIKPIVGKSTYDWAFGSFEPDGSAVVTAAFEYDGASPLIPVSLRGRYLFQRWPIEGGEPQLLGILSSTRVPMPGLDLERGLMVNGFRNELYLRRLKKLTSDPARVVARLPEVLALNSRIVFDPVADRLAICDSGGNLWLWPLNGDGSVPERKLHAPGSPWWTAFSHDGAHLAHASESGVRVWDLLGPVGSDPLLLTPSFAMGVAFTPDNRWLVAGHGGLGLPLWPVTQPYARTLHIHDGEIGHLQFSADGSRLFTLGRNDGKVLSIALTGGAGLEPETLLEMEPQYGWHLQADARGRFLIASGTGEIWMIPASGSAPSRIDQLEWFKSFSLDPAGRLAAGAVPNDTVTPTVIVFDLETGERREFDEPGDGQAGTPIFDAVGRMLVARGGVLSRWDPSTDSTEVLVDEGVGGYYPFGDGRRLFLGVDGVRVIHDLADGSQRRLAEAHQRGGAFAFDESGSIVATGRGSGEIRVGPLFDETPHLLLGHDGPVFQVEISPDGTWIVSTGQDGTVRFWPLPDFSKPPLHTLPHDELLTRLKALTNIRVVPTEDSYTGYTFGLDPTAYRGWAEVPEW